MFSAFSEKEKTESPSSDDISDDIPAASPLETVEAPLAEDMELPPPTDMEEENAKDDVNDQPTESET